jgi:hypothetical protein
VKIPRSKRQPGAQEDGMLDARGVRRSEVKIGERSGVRAGVGGKALVQLKKRVGGMMRDRDIVVISVRWYVT